MQFFELISFDDLGKYPYTRLEIAPQGYDGPTYEAWLMPSGKLVLVSDDSIHPDQGFELVRCIDVPIEEAVRS